ncbi:DUF6119 family protein [Amycolatopsis sp. WAC 01376]|uniref:DUF6119 family protein n=1 Tax=Amycolatopsis sp. WAC 01376 TaxID=2203195 RepID=UPI00131563E6|nr:DUF6119 family protein [Amycolatopsis sp. WAC 01376]
MARSRAFSIFLLKDGFDATTALKDDNPLIESVPASNLPVGATLFVLDGPARPPWWKSYFGVQRELFQASKGALVFVPIAGRVCVLAFGHVSHNLRDESYEYDFGIKVTLNCVDPQKLKNTDTLEPGSARRQRTQHAIETELTYFDFDQDSSVLKSITGKVKDEYADVVKHATGASSLRVSTPVTSADLTDLCERMLVLYADESYMESFPDIQKIVPVRDPAHVSALNRQLQQQIRVQADNIYLAVPDMIDYGHDSDSMYATFSGCGGGDLCSDVAIEHYYDYLAANGVAVSALTVEQLKAHRLHLVNEHGDARDSHPVFKSLLFDTSLPGSDAAFYLNEGNWYEVDRDYVNRLRTRLDPFWSELAFLDDCKHHLEADYNEEIGTKAGFVCLDKTNVSRKGQTQIEPCDVFTVIGGHAVLIHVKISTASSQLSHLFNQGANSVELLKSDDDAPGRLIKCLREKRKSTDDIDALVASVEDGDYEVVFAIITAKDPDWKALNLPLFSRISLARNVRVLRRVMGVPVSFGFVKDVSPPQPPKPKTKKPAKPRASKKGTLKP